MKLNKYLDFISENAKSGKMMIFYSDSLRELFKNIAAGDGNAKNVARVLLEVEDNNDVKDTYTLIDKTEKNDMISYVQTSRFYREYPHSVLDKQRGPFIKNSKFWTSGRTPQYGIGRWVRHVFNDVRETPISNGDLENFVNAYKSTYDKIGMRSDGFEIVKGEDIRYWYLEDRYDEVRGQLGKSCMRKEYCQPYLDIYVQNPDVCSLLILKNSEGDKIVGRAIVWTISNGDLEGRQVMDRIYTIEDSDIGLFDTYAKEHNILRNSSVYSQSINVKKGRYDYYPYMDTFCYLDYEKGILTTSIGDEESSLELKNTDGTGSSNEGRVWSSYHGEHIYEDDARWCEDVDSYVHYENAVWLEYKDICVSDSADTTYSEYHGGCYYTEDVVHSECMDDYLDPEDSDIIEFYTDSKGNTDYCTKYDTQYYIEIEDKKFYSRDRYIVDPYTGEYHFKDDIVDGVEFIKGLDERLEKELDIKERYTKEDGSFDLAKYKRDIKEELFTYEPSEAFLDDMDLQWKKKYSSSSIGGAYLLPAFYAWIIRDESAGSVSSSRWNRDPMFRYMKLAYDLLEEIPEESLASAGFKGDKEDIKKFYKDKFQFNSSTTNLVSTFESIDLSKLPSKIYKMIVYMNM